MFNETKSKIQNLKSKIRNHSLAILILLAFISLGIIYSLVTPPFEAGDESRHYAVVKYMADTARLPVQRSDEAQIHWSHEGNQPPLYYALAAALTFWIETGDWNDVFWYNPHTTIGNPLRPDNKNITIHPPGEGWPWQGPALAVHLIRFLSLTMATVTVATCYLIALHLFRGNRWLAAGAMTITAFNPMFIFISASVNNDNAVIMFVTLALYIMIRMSEDVKGRGRNDESSSPNVNHYSILLLGVLIGLGALSKLYALGLLPLVGFLFFWLAYQIGGQDGILSSKFWRSFLTWSLMFGLVVVAIAGWFYVRNALLYDGDILALQVMRETAGQRASVPSLATLRAEFEGFRIAYWALFGGVNILVDPWIYTILDGVSLVAVFGVITFVASGVTYYLPGPTPYLLGGIRYQISRPVFIILIGWYVIMISGFIVWNLTQPAGQGRLLYPAIAAISALGMLGLTWWLPDRIRRWLVGLCMMGLFAFATLVPIYYIAPVYAKTAILTQAELPPDLQPVDVIHDDAMRLIGYQLHTQVVRPAESLSLTLYWEMLHPVDLNYSIFVHLLGRQRQVVGQIDTYPGGGQWPTTLLAPGDILADHYEVPISPTAEFNQAPTRLLIATGIYDFSEPGRPGRPVTNVAGELVEPIIASAKLIPWQWPTPSPLESPINFFDKVTLLNYQLAPDQTSVTFDWQAHTSFEIDYTVFIQAWSATSQTRSSSDADTSHIAGFDGPPLQGDYPTSLWEPGEIIVDKHPLDLTTLSPGDYDLLAGLYDPITGDRLPAFGPDGPLPDYAVNLGRIQVTASNDTVAR